MTTYSNPRMRAVIENWPIGRDKRATATFEVEVNGKGERAVRVTTGAPKKRTYAHKVRIVDGDDGRTYLAELHGYHVTIARGDMQYSHESVFPRDPRFLTIMELFGDEGRALAVKLIAAEGVQS
jgi:hypothetical protein